MCINIRNFQGQVKPERCKRYDYATLPGDVPDNWMSSLTIPTGWSVDVYPNASFGGTLCTFTADSSFVGSGCNDVMSSFRIR